MVKTRASKVAEYWAHQAGNGFMVDWGEPACFACGWYREEWPQVGDDPHDWRFWDRANLERCHLTPASLGGPDVPSNLVLLCHICHQAAPNVSDPNAMLEWVRQRPSNSPFAEFWNISKEIVAKVDPASVVLLKTPRLRAAIDQVASECTTHWGQGGFNGATKAWAVQQALNLIQRDEVDADRGLRRLP